MSKKSAVDFIRKGDCVELLKGLPKGSVDLVFADPPYFLQLGGDLTRPDNSEVDACDDEWDKFDNLQAYEEFTKAWLSAAREALHENGTIMVSGSYHNIFMVGAAMQKMGFWILNDIIWNKSNPMPNFKGTRFTNAHETIIWAAKSQKSKYCFNYNAMKLYNEDKQMRDDWDIPLCTGNERLKDDEGNKLHATQKPETLLHRIIIACTKPGDLVVDPFFGTGTTGAVAKKLRRHWIGFDRDEKYIKYAQRRIDAVVPYDEEHIGGSLNKRTEAKIPFGDLVAKGLIPAGTELMDSKGNVMATVTTDGYLKTKGNERGSIHKIGTQIQRSPCNGWTYWHMRKGSSLVPIDSVRQEVRAELARQKESVSNLTLQ